MMSFIYSGSEARITGLPMLTRWMVATSYVRRHNSLLKDVLISFDSDAKKCLLNFLMFLQIVSTDIYNGYPTSLV